MHTIRQLVWDGGKLTFCRDSLLIWVGEVVQAMVCYINSMLMMLGESKVCFG
jgi:hypothetical protein